MAGLGPNKYIVLSIAIGAILLLSLGGLGGNKPSRTKLTINILNTLGNLTLFLEAELDIKVERLRFL